MIINIIGQFSMTIVEKYAQIMSMNVCSISESYVVLKSESLLSPENGLYANITYGDICDAVIAADAVAA